MKNKKMFVTFLEKAQSIVEIQNILYYYLYHNLNDAAHTVLNVQFHKTVSFDGDSL
ncbi:MAG: hypothetical protein ACP5NV_05155 [Candidatus Woesearchaeota archaeon]